MVVFKILKVIYEKFIYQTAHLKGADPNFTQAHQRGFENESLNLNLLNIS